MNNNFNQISCSDFETSINNNTSILIDVRTLQERKEFGIIKRNDTNPELDLHIDISLPDAADKIQELNRDNHYLIYCWHGVRSASVRDFMQQHDFLYVQDLKGGIDVWNTSKNSYKIV